MIGKRSINGLAPSDLSGLKDIFIAIIVDGDQSTNAAERLYGVAIVSPLDAIVR